MFKRIKQNLVWRYIHLVPNEQIKEYSENRLFRELADESYKNLSAKMIDTFYKETR